MSRSLGRVAALAVVVAAIASPGAAQPASPCGDLFPDVTWDFVGVAAPVTVRVAGMPEGRAERVADDIRQAVDLIHPELGGLDGVEVCVFDDDLPLDAAALGWPVGQQLRAASFGPERAVVLSAWNIGLIRPAATHGLAHQAEWGIAPDGYPDPLGAAVAQWYVARVEGRLDSYHAWVRYANLIRDIPEEIPWTAGVIEDMLLWNPEFQRSPIGDFVDFAVSRDGLDAVRDPDPARLAQLQVAWQRALLDEARGSSRPTTGWIVGAAFAGAVVGATALIALLGWRHRRRRRRRAMATLPIADDSTSAPTGAGSPRDG